MSGSTTITQANLSWNAVVGASSYKVYRDGVEVADVLEEQHKDTGLTSATTYKYQVSAMNKHIESDLSEFFEVTTQTSGGGE